MKRPALRRAAHVRTGMELCGTVREFLTRAVRSGVRWLRPGRALKAGLLLLALSAVVSVVLSGVAMAAPEPPPPAPRATVPPYLKDPGVQEPAPGSTARPPAVPDATTPPYLKPPGPPPATQDPAQSDLHQGLAQQRKDNEKASRAAFDKQVAAYKKARSGQDGILGSFGVTDRDGNPVTAYRIYADTGDWNDWDLSVAHMLVELLFLGNKWLVSFACFLISWSLAFSLAGLLLKPALHISTSLYGGIVVQVGLPSLFLTITLVVASWHLMFGNRVRGWGEMAAALVISALALGALASPPQLLLSKDTGAIAVVRDIALEAAALVLDQQAIENSRPTTDAEWEKTAAGPTVGAQVRSASSALARPITDALVDAFVARPAMLLSYGKTFDGRCGTLFRTSRIEQAVLDQSIDQALKNSTKPDTDLLKKIPFVGEQLSDLYEGAATVPKQALREALTSKGPAAEFEKECLKGDTASRKASIDKVGGAAFMLLAAFLVCLFITVLVCGFLFGQVRIALEAMLAKVALAVGVLPGPGRAWLWDRAQSIARSLALILASVVSLAVLIVVVNAVLNASEQDLPGGLTVRFIVLDVLCVAAFLFRKRLARTTRRAVLRARQRIGASPLGGAAPAPALDSPRKRGGLGKGLLVGGLMLGALAASGGTSAALGGGRYATGRLAGRIGGTALRGTGRAVGEVARVGTKGAGRTALFGLKATAGLPVYGPRAARSIRTAATSLPQRIATGAGRATRDVRRTFAPLDAVVDEGIHNLRSLGRIVTGRPGLGQYTPRRTPAPARRALPRPPAPRPQLPAAPPAPATPPARRRPAPPHVATPPASAAQALLHRRLHRVQTRTTTSTPTASTSTPPTHTSAPMRRTPPAPGPGIARRRRP